VTSKKAASLPDCAYEFRVKDHPDDPDFDSEDDDSWVALPEGVGRYPPLPLTTTTTCMPFVETGVFYAAIVKFPAPPLHLLDTRMIRGPTSS